MQIAAITVTYNPNTETMAAQHAALVHQTGTRIIADNGSRPELQRELQELVAQDPRGTRWIGLGENHGLGAALNRGIEVALELGADFVLLLDHDSIPPKDLVATLMNDWGRAESSGWNPGCIGPKIFDRKENLEVPFVRAPASEAPEIPGLCDCYHIFTSGSLISAEALRTSGLMDATFFIDQIDVEWCLRARRSDYRIVGSEQIRLDHSLGDWVFRIPVLNKRIFASSPPRNYFMVRNMVRLLRRNPADGRWRRRNLIHILYRAAVYALFLGHPLQRTAYMLRGLRDGLLDRGGPLPH